ncbi:hypothetical protein E2R51_08100 [Jeotgalibacillus sp. S-D1]|uniref:hypothetical protein n=1 Tax=Jeotgalibacillus sp. S-D1 TaxID=2552189 RepID=UPI00105A0636|nr:hypothetical protein [Jeotgalibacillus sp. S-D1]TDL32637.1 hypothetical protein E2R51_08100 [Jeotgalibacillus sp. S-D1]
MQKEALMDHTPRSPRGEMSTKGWVWTLLLLMIPLVNLVLLAVWAFGREGQKKNYSRASFIVAGILLAICGMVYLASIILGFSLN